MLTWSSSGSCCAPSRRPKHPKGHPDEAGRDVTHLSVLLDDAIESGEGDVAEALRPIYLDYLVKHDVSG